MWKTNSLFPILLLLSCNQVGSQERESVLIEVLSDVRIEPQVLGRSGEKGRLDYFRATTPAAVVLELNKGQRFEMVQDLGEGSCRIEFEGNRFDLQSCPWLPGFRDPQSDVFRVVAE
jgi:hypothetical protein